MLSDLTGIQQARTFLAKYFPATPLVATQAGPAQLNAYLKLECELPTGSFKVRGAMYSLFVNRERRAFSEVVAASTGNHGAAVAYAARELGLRAKIFLPRDPNPAKLTRIVTQGAEVVISGADLSAAIDAAGDYARREKAFFLHDASDADIPFGTGTIGLEVLEQLPSVEAIYVPVGDTALIRGVAAAVKACRPQTRVIGAVAKGAPCYYLSWQAGKAVETPAADTVADGLAVTRPILENVVAIRKLVDDMVLVEDDEMLTAAKRLWSLQRVKAEPSGAAGVAAMWKRPEAGGPRVGIVTGSNIAPNLAARLCEPNDNFEKRARRAKFP